MILGNHAHRYTPYRQTPRFSFYPILMLLYSTYYIKAHTTSVDPEVDCFRVQGEG